MSLENDIFEGIGKLYYERFGRLRPGKDDRVARTTQDLEENSRRFAEWIKYEALDNAVLKIQELEAKLAVYPWYKRDSEDFR